MTAMEVQRLEVADRRGMVFMEDTDSDADSENSYAQIGDAEEGAEVEEVEEGASSKSDSSSIHSAGEDLADYWDPYLYQLQLQSPSPNCIPCSQKLNDRPPIYGKEYHGCITRDATARLLGTNDGNYLVRQGLSHSGTYSLSFYFGGQVRHYRLFHDGQDHYVGEKPFETIEDLVQDGLITLYMEANDVEEYLQSARQTRSARRNTLGPLDTIQEDDPPCPDEGVFSGEGSEDDLSAPPVPPRHYLDEDEVVRRGPNYHPCTIPQLRNSTHSPEYEPETRMESGHSRSIVYESVGAVPLALPLSLGEGGGKGGPVGRDGAGFADLLADSKARKESLQTYHYDKPHNFKIHNYIGLPWCDFCRNFMWGLRNQGYRCKDCGCNAHKQCKDDAANDCQPSRQLIKRVFGVELTTLVKMQGTKVPLLIRSCIEEVERRALDVEGLYRLSGCTSDILRLKKQFDHDMCADFSVDTDIHAITGVLKLYLRELPIPLMTFDAYDLCLIAARSNSEAECLDMLKVALCRLPPAHFNTLRHLLRHLVKVRSLSHTNKMDDKNLAVVFTPTIMRSPYHTGVAMMKKLPEQKKAVHLLIKHFDTLFQT